MLIGGAPENDDLLVQPTDVPYLTPSAPTPATDNSARSTPPRPSPASMPAEIGNMYMSKLRGLRRSQR
ncbi:hypothetical protein AG1IA_02706 [Rhizoctonia solani AG-1 IA]|uniref:Uncharacterized protein n=1 Tax=Thanatephorus cucumeris (strain AG1-IA) TaxID=983506 RepID=L8X2N7_THACA|nr:hypothetical protein AG1IA_02706 [Rhizoctonia solani AG-1 IA]